MPWSGKRKDRETFEREDAIADKREKANKNAQSREIADNPSTKPKGRLFGIIPSRQERNEKLDAEPIGEDDGPIEDKGLTKKRGWFGIGGNRDAETKPAATEASPGVVKSVKAEVKVSQVPKQESAAKSGKRSFWSRGSSVSVASGDNTKPAEPAGSDGPKAKRGWVSKFSKSYQQNTELADKPTAKQPVVANKQPATQVAQDVAKDVTTQEGPKKKSWLSFGSGKSKEPKAAKPVSKKPERSEMLDASEPATKSGRRGLFGMLDGLKLKPPTDEVDKKSLPSATKPVPIKPGQPIPSTQSDNDDEGDDDSSGRPMSKADRKRLRRQGLDDRRAA